MVWWSREFDMAVEEATKDKFYVDDNDLITEELPPGSRLVEGKVQVIEEEAEGDSLLPGDQRTAVVIKEIANNVCPYTRVTVDYPSAHPSGWMPLLDIKVKMLEDNTIDWSFFKKTAPPAQEHQA